MAHILIVDADEVLSEIASEILISAGHACGWVTNVTDAESLLAWRRPDLILLDQSLGGESGMEFLRRLRTSSQFYDLPVIIVSAMASQEDVARAHYNGAQAHVPKPISPNILLWRVNQTLKARSNRPKHRDLDDLGALHLHDPLEQSPRQSFV